MSNEHFAMIGGAISPQPWMQYRPLVTAEAASVSRSYGASGGGNKDALVHTIDVKWTNNSPIRQWVYGMVTRDGAYVSLQARSRGFLVMSHGVAFHSSPTLPEGFAFEMVEVSRFGCGMSVGQAGTLALGTGLGVHRVWKYSATSWLMPHDIGWYLVEPGETFFARVTVRFVSEFWENASIDGGESGTESGFISGDTRVDLFGIPDTSQRNSRPTPTVVGVGHDVAVSSATDVDVPAGTEEDDVILAVVANRLGGAGDIQPQQTGWTLLHVRNDGAGGFGDTHLKVYARIATDDEPDSYGFTTGVFSEETAHLIVLRDASHDFEDRWHIASTLRLGNNRNTSHVCPSIDRVGQLLICASYFAHDPVQAPISQAPPEDMTEISDVAGVASTMALAVLPDPPWPSRERAFVPSKIPKWTGRSISLTILVTGAQTS